MLTSLACTREQRQQVCVRVGVHSFAAHSFPRAVKRRLVNAQTRMMACGLQTIVKSLETFNHMSCFALAFPCAIHFRMTVFPGWNHVWKNQQWRSRGSYFPLFWPLLAATAPMLLFRRPRWLPPGVLAYEARFVTVASVSVVDSSLSTFAYSRELAHECLCARQHFSVKAQHAYSHANKCGPCIALTSLPTRSLRQGSHSALALRMQADNGGT